MKNCKMFFILFIICILCGCYNSVKEDDKTSNKLRGKLITDPVLQDSLFSNLNRLTQNSINNDKQHDSLVFLLLPVRASCPACRKKTIDSIVKYKDQLDEKHFVVVSGNGFKSISGYFKELNKQVPHSKGIFYDTTELTSNINMSSTNPNIYYTHNAKVYRKVSCLPSTIKDDLNDFFLKK